MFAYEGVRAMFLGLKFHLKAIFGGLRFEIKTSQFWIVKSFSNCHFFLIQFCNTSKIVSYHQIYD